MECLQHLVETEKVFQFRVQAFLAGHNFPNFNPNTDGYKPGRILRWRWRRSSPGLGQYRQLEGLVNCPGRQTTAIVLGIILAVVGGMSASGGGQ